MDLNSIITEDRHSVDDDTYTANKVFYLPTGLSGVQRDLVEVLVKIHKSSLLRKLKDSADDLSTKYNETRPESELPALSDDGLMSLLRTNLSLIENHPYLLVEHYMPKKLLLMEPHEKLMLASDKFKKFDQLLSVVINLKLNIVVVGHSIKELDLIEGFILGRRLKYKRYSGATLYDGNKQELKHGVGLYHSSDPNDAVAEKKPAKDDEYAPKHKKQQSGVESSEHPLNLHLITSQKLKSMNFSFDNVYLDFIISFDPSLDENNDRIDFIRSTNNSAYTNNEPVPLIKLVVEQSAIHGLVKLKDSIRDSDKLMDETLYSSLVNRNVDYTSKYEKILGTTFQNIKPFFENCLENKWPIVELPDFSTYSNEEIIASIEQDHLELSPQTGNSKKKIKLEQVQVPDQLTIKDYKALLARLTIERISQIQCLLNEKKSDILSLRLKYTLYQNKIESIKSSIGESYKESQKLKEEVVGAEKKYDRLELEAERFGQVKKDLTEKNEFLTKVNNGGKVLDEQELDSEIRELKEALSKLDTSNTEQSIKAEDLRTQYQQVTSEAAEKSTRAKSLEERSKMLQSQLDGQGRKLRKLKDEEIVLNNEETIAKLQANLEFLEKYEAKLSGVVKEKISTLNIGRNGRIYRSTTPYS